MTNETLNVVLALGVPVASAVGGYLARGLVSFMRGLVNDAIDARIEARELKARSKSDARTIRMLRMEDEQRRHGRVSVAPPAYDDDTGIYETIREEDRAWLAARDPHAAWGANPDPSKPWEPTESTPPEGTAAPPRPPVLRPPRPRQR